MSRTLAGYFPGVAYPPMPKPKPPKPKPLPPRRWGRRPLDLTGQVYGQLRAIEPSGRVDKWGLWWRCECLRCGAHAEVRAQQLRDTTYPRTCGCLPQRRREPRWWER